MTLVWFLLAIWFAVWVGLPLGGILWAVCYTAIRDLWK